MCREVIIDNVRTWIGKDADKLTDDAIMLLWRNYHRAVMGLVEIDNVAKHEECFCTWLRSLTGGWHLWQALDQKT